MRIFIDFEATEGGEIIAVGAIAENGKTFSALCRPVFSPLTERITTLTGITSEMVEALPHFWGVCRNLVAWAANLDLAYGVHFFAFGKNDREFLKTTYDMCAFHGLSEPIHLDAMKWLIENLSNGAAPIYKAFDQQLVGLRSAYLTYKSMCPEALIPQHCPLEDAMMFKELFLAVEDGWSLPEGAELVKVEKPSLPKKAPAEDFNTPAELHRTVVCYWMKGNKDKSAVFRDLVTAAKALCTKALGAGVTPEKAAYRILQAAVAGESYCDKKFFLVD